MCRYVAFWFAGSGRIHTAEATTWDAFFESRAILAGQACGYRTRDGLRLGDKAISPPRFLPSDPSLFRNRFAPGRWSGFLASDATIFFRESIRSLSVSASLFPSSRYLAQALLRHVDFSRIDVMIELGVGTGAVSLEILRRLRPDARLYAFDINPVFVTHIQGRIRDPRLIPVLGRAEHLQKLMKSLRIPKADAIVSSLGLSNMDEQLRSRIMGQAVSCLSPGGLLSQYQYLHIGGEANWLRRVGLRRFSEERFLRRYFGTVHSERVIRNLPPAMVFSCRR
jgi:phospholipid N-methyltransferase